MGSILLSEIKEQDENCYKCKFWKQQSFEEIYGGDPSTLQGGDLDGLCRRYAPQPFITENLDTEEHIFVTWCTTYADDFCGDFVPSNIVYSGIEESNPDVDENIKKIILVFKSRRIWGTRGLFADIARKTGFTPAYVGQVFTGKKAPAKKFLLAVCAAFNIHINIKE
jgi:hypothetical protein